MALNILDIVKSALGSQSIGQIGKVLGENESATRSAIDLAVPSILGGLIKKASTPSGANAVLESVRDADGGLLNNLGTALGGGKHAALIQTGMNMLGSIFGQQQSGMLGTIARMAGIGQNSTGSLLGILAPIVMGALSNARSSQNLDAGGLANLLSSQKEHVARALPRELQENLGIEGILSEAGNTVRSASTTNPVQRATNEPARSGWLTRVLPIAALAALGFLAFKFLMPGTEEVAVNTQPASTAVANNAAVNSSALDISKLTGDVQTTLTDVTSAISGITDEASAKAAVDTLTGAATTLKGFDLSALPGPAKSTLSGVSGPLLEKLKGALETAYAIPGVKGIIEPIVTPIIDNVSALVG